MGLTLSDLFYSPLQRGRKKPRYYKPESEAERWLQKQTPTARLALHALAVGIEISNQQFQHDQAKAIINEKVDISQLSEHELDAIIDVACRAHELLIMEEKSPDE